jgi:hypothetical protein
MLHPKSKLLAHTVKTSGDVAATFHLEPSHNPKAGEPSNVWFALTKAGGEVIPLEACNCQLVVKQAEKTIAQPVLKPINAEQYQGIPSSDIVFPTVGIYQLEISGQPKVAEAFKPFKLNYEVTVQPGQAASSSISPNSSLVTQQPNQIKQPQAERPSTPNHWLIGGAIGLGLVAILIKQLIGIKKRRL